MKKKYVTIILSNRISKKQNNDFNGIAIITMLNNAIIAVWISNIKSSNSIKIWCTGFYKNSTWYYKRLFCAYNYHTIGLCVHRLDYDRD